MKHSKLPDNNSSQDYSGGEESTHGVSAKSDSYPDVRLQNPHLKQSHENSDNDAASRQDAVSNFSQLLVETDKNKKFENMMVQEQSEAGFGQEFGHHESNPDGSTNNVQPPTQSPDIITIIRDFGNTEQLPDAFQNYKCRSDILSVEEITASQFVKIKRYKNCVYFGEVINGKRHGKGIMVSLNYRVYEGDWQNDLKHGRGVEIGTTGNRYEGEFLNNKPEGAGTFTWPNGESYEGEWKNGLKHGSGGWKGVKGESYTGEWKYGKADGYGVHVWRNGNYC